jgi:hypothetical protein
MYAHLGPCTNNVVNYNKIHNNTEWGLNASWTGGWITNATNNWWGNSTGPYHPTLNSPGLGDNVSDNVTFIPWLGGEPVNDPPIINNTGPFEAIEDEEFFHEFHATDPEGEELEWEFQTEISWLTWNPNNLSVIGTPTNEDVGNGTITVKVTDRFNASDEVIFNLIVVNVAPEILGNDKPYAVEDMLYETDYSSTDDGQGNITWSLISNGTWLNINKTTGMLFGMPRNEDVGDQWVNISVNDGNGGIGSRNITITIRNTNDAPVPLEDILVINMTEDVPFSMNLSQFVTDPDGDRLDFVVFHQGHIEVMIYNDGTMDLLPEGDWSGFENFTVLIRDPFMEVPLEVEVTVIPVFDAPTDPVITPPPGPYYENTTYIFTGSSSDVDIPYGDELHFTWEVMPPGSTFNGSTVEINLTAGNYTLILNVSDLGGAYVTATLDIEVLPVAVDNDTEPEPNGTEPDDDDEEPVDDDEEPVDDDEEPVDDDEEPVDDDDDKPEKDETTDPIMLLMVTTLIGLFILLVVIIIFAMIRRGDDWDEE